MLFRSSGSDVFYIGSEGVTTVSGFPINSFERMIFGMMENTVLWGCATNLITAYVLDLGL